MVQAVGLCLAGGLAHILAVPEQAVEVELVGVLAVGGQTGIAGWRGKKWVCSIFMSEQELYYTSPCNKTWMCAVLVLELQEARFDLWLGVLQRGGGQGGVGRQVGHGGRHLRDAACQLLPGQQGGRRGAVAGAGGEVGHVHGGVVAHGDGGSRLERDSFAGFLGLTEHRLRLHLQRGSEVEAETTKVKL